MGEEIDGFGRSSRCDQILRASHAYSRLRRIHAPITATAETTIYVLCLRLSPRGTRFLRHRKLVGPRRRFSNFSGWELLRPSGFNCLTSGLPTTQELSRDCSTVGQSRQCVSMCYEASRSLPTTNSGGRGHPKRRKCSQYKAQGMRRSRQTKMSECSRDSSFSTPNELVFLAATRQLPKSLLPSSKSKPTRITVCGSRRSYPRYQKEFVRLIA